MHQDIFKLYIPVVCLLSCVYSLCLDNKLLVIVTVIVQILSY